MTLKAVFLDVGNTLLREQPERFEIYAEAARQRGVEIDRDGMLDLMRRAHHELPREIDGGFRYSDPWFEVYIRHIFHGELGLPEEQLGELARELFARFEDPRTFRLFPGALELLDGLHARGLVAGVISNWSARLPGLLAALDLAGRFDVVLCSAIEGVEKPDAAIFEAALERAGVEPGEALHAGDHPVKDGAAREAGLDFVLVEHGGGTPHLDREAHGSNGLTRVASLPELGALVEARLS